MRACSNCGAPMAIGPPGEIERCTFCGAEEREPNVPPAPAPVPADTVVASAPSGNVGLVVMLVVAGLVVGGGIVAAVALSSPSSPRALPMSRPTSSPSPRPIPPTPLPTASVLNPADLPTADLARSMPLVAPGMVGSYQSYDVVANFGWVLGIARSWRPDATIRRVRVTHASKDGTIDVTNMAQVDYDIAPPTWATGIGLWLHTLGRTPSLEVRAVPSIEAGEVEMPKCSLHRAFAALASVGALAKVMQDDLSATLAPHGGHTEWAVGFIMLASGAGGEGGVVDAATCAVTRR